MNERITALGLIADREIHVKYAQDNLKAMKRSRAILNKSIDLVYQSLATVEERVTISIWSDTNSWAEGTAAVTLYVDVYADITSMKEGLVPDLLATLLRFEYDAKSTSDDAERSKRQFNFKREATDHHCAINLSFYARIKEEDTGTCHRIQTGTKLVEVPQYQLVCD